MKIYRLFLVFITLIYLVSCTDMYDPVLWSNGRFTLEYGDGLLENASLRMEDSPESVIPASVFEVGSNDIYIVVKQHPNRDSSITNYFYLNTYEFPAVEPFIPNNYVKGPLTEAEFLQKKLELKLPEFTFSIDSVK